MSIICKLMLARKRIYPIAIFNVINWLLCVCTHVSKHACMQEAQGKYRGQRTTGGSQFYLPTLWGLELRMMSSGLFFVCFVLFTKDVMKAGVRPPQWWICTPHRNSNIFNFQGFIPLCPFVCHKWGEGSRIMRWSWLYRATDSEPLKPPGVLVISPHQPNY